MLLHIGNALARQIAPNSVQFSTPSDDSRKAWAEFTLTGPAKVSFSPGRIHVMPSRVLQIRNEHCLGQNLI